MLIASNLCSKDQLENVRTDKDPKISTILQLKSKLGLLLDESWQVQGKKRVKSSLNCRRKKQIRGPK